MQYNNCSNYCGCYIGTLWDYGKSGIVGLVAQKSISYNY